MINICEIDYDDEEKFEEEKDCFPIERGDN